MEITPSAGSDRWAVAQAGPFERMDINGGLELYPASYGYASGGYIADSIVTGQASSVSQQQYYTKDSTLGSWSGSVWNMVFSGVNGAPAQSYPTPPMTTLASTPVARDIPYMYVDSSGNYNVFEPSLRTNAVGPSWSPTSNTPGTSVPMSTFFVATPSDTAAQINSALAEGCNLLFTPGVYSINQTLNVNNPNTVVLGLGFPTLIPTGGVDTMHVADVDGVRLQGLLFDAGTTNSNTLLQIGPAGSSASHASNPISVQDVFFRIGGDIAGQATNSLVVNSNNTLVDDIWAWRADHGNSGTVGWTVNTAQHGLVVNGNNVLATGLFVEHYQNYDVQWFGNGGETIFFQNEMPYDPPNQAAWMNGTSDGYAAYEVGPERHHPPGLRARQLLLLRRQYGGGRRPRVRGARCPRRAVPRHPHGLPGRRRHDRARHQRGGRGNAHQHHPVHGNQLPIANRLPLANQSSRANPSKPSRPAHPPRRPAALRPGTPVRPRVGRPRVNYDGLVPPRLHSRQPQVDVLRGQLNALRAGHGSVRDRHRPGRHGEDHAAGRGRPPGRRRRDPDVLRWRGPRGAGGAARADPGRPRLGRRAAPRSGPSSRAQPVS